MQIDLTEQQTVAYDYLTNEQDMDLCYGGAKGGGKSFLMCLWVFSWCKWLKTFFDIKKSSYPIPVGFLGRKRAADFNDTTFETWKKIIPASAYTIRQQDKEIVIDNAVKVQYGGLDDQDTINKFNSAEFAFLAIDQAEETERDDISVLEASLRLKVNGKTPPYKKLYTANPRAGWLKQDFIKGERKNGIFIKALPSDNPHLPVNYEETLRQSFSYSPALLQAYLYGEWDVFEGMFFEEFNRQYHVYNPRAVKILDTWPRFRTIDWGYASPMAVHWHAVAPDGHIYTYREYYKTKVLDVVAAQEVAKLSEGEELRYTVGDPQSFPVEIPHFKFGKMVPMKRSEVWAEQGVHVVMGNSDRVAGWSRMREYLRVRDYMGGKSSWWHISSDCVHLIDEITSAVHDERRIEDIAADCCDHALEGCRLGLMSRPPLPDVKKQDMTMLEAAEAYIEKQRSGEVRRVGLL